MLDPLQVYEKWFEQEESPTCVDLIHNNVGGKDENDSSPVADPKNCYVKQPQSGLFQAASRERGPDEL